METSTRHADWRWHSRLGLELNASLQLLDLLTTAVLVGAIAGAAEANPVSRAIMDGWGLSGWIALKLALAVAFLALIPWLGHAKRSEQVTAAFLSALFAGFMLFVFVNNAVLIVLHA